MKEAMKSILSELNEPKTATKAQSKANTGNNKQSENASFRTFCADNTTIQHHEG